MRAGLVLICIAAAAGLETLLIRAFAFHPAWGLNAETSSALFVSYVSWASVPLAAAVLLVIGATAFRRPIQRVMRPLLVVSGVGPLLAFIALRQVSDSAAGFLAVGFLIQCGTVLYAGFKVLRNAT